MRVFAFAFYTCLPGMKFNIQMNGLCISASCAVGARPTVIGLTVRCCR